MSARKTTHHVPERFLRQLWKHQSFATNGLITTDERPVEVLSPGVLNRDGGPDFSNALIRIGGTLFRGAVELHQYVEEWTAHGHERDPKYNQVILHVALHRGPADTLSLSHCKRSIPLLVLSEYLTGSFRQTWEQMILGERAERLSTIKCCSSNDQIEASVIRRWIAKLAVERVEIKVQRFEERLKELAKESRSVVREVPPPYEDIPFGLNPEELPSPDPDLAPHEIVRLPLWEQLLYEGTMEALGYSKNQQPFLRLAKCVPLTFFKELVKPSTPFHVQQLDAVLFNVAGLLPSLRDIAEPEARRHAQQLKRDWKDLRPMYHGPMLSIADWQYFRLRPENFPTTRLAGAARLIPQMLQGGFFKSIMDDVRQTGSTPAKTHRALEERFIIDADGFWNDHYSFHDRSGSMVKTLIGVQRARDIILNVVIPLCLLYARLFKNREIREQTLALYDASPPSTSNTVTRTIEAQLLKGKLPLSSAKMQQGALQLYKFFCVEERCAECAIGKIVFP